MNQEAKQLSYAVESVSRALAEWTVVAHAEKDTTLPDRYGGSWRRDWLDDARARMAYLSQALAVRRPELLAHMVRWVAGARPHDRQTTLDLQTSLRCSADVVADQLPGDAGLTAASYLQGAAESLNAPLPLAGDRPRTDMPYTDSRLELMEALLGADRDKATRLVTKLLDDGLSLRDLYVDVLRVTLKDVGEMWHAGEISVGDEHFSTETIRDIMSMARTRFPAVQDGRPRIIACAVSGDLHDVGLRMVADLFQLDGWPTTYLGANLPVEDLVLCIKEQQARLVALSMGTCMHIRTGGETIEAIRAAHPDVRILVGGYPFQLLPDLWRELDADGVANAPDEAVLQANAWLNS